MVLTVQSCTNCAAWSELFGDRHFADHQQCQPTENGYCPTCTHEDTWRPRTGDNPPDRAEGGDEHADRQKGHADESDDPLEPGGRRSRSEFRVRLPAHRPNRLCCRVYDSGHAESRPVDEAAQEQDLPDESGRYRLIQRGRLTRKTGATYIAGFPTRNGGPASS